MLLVTMLRNPGIIYSIYIGTIVTVWMGLLIMKKNIYVMNDEYYGRKSICDQIYDKYKTYDFVWTNQSCIYRFL